MRKISIFGAKQQYSMRIVTARRMESVFHQIYETMIPMEDTVLSLTIVKHAFCA